MNVRTSTASLGGLQGLVWNAFSVVAGASAYAQIVAPNFTVDHIATYPNRPPSSQWTALAVGPNLVNCLQLVVAGGGVAPAWAIPGAAVNVNVTYQGVPMKFATNIKELSADGKTITFSMGSNLSQIITKSLANVALDAIAGSVVNSITLNIQCQKAMFQVQTGQNINIAPVADATGANPPYFVTLTPGGAEYEITAPTGSKFNLADFWIKSASATPTLTIRFL